MQIRATPQTIEYLNDHRISMSSERDQGVDVGDILEFAHSCEIEPYVGIYAGKSLCSIGFQTYSNSTLNPHITIGRYCSIGPDVTYPIYRHPLEYISTSPFTHELNPRGQVIRVMRDMRPSYANIYPNPQKPPPKIGHDVWVGAASLIAAGVTLGTGCVVASGSVVTQSVPAYQIVGGNPAQIIRPRFPREIISRLLASEWWRYNFLDFDGLDLSNPNNFCRSFELRKPSLEPYEPPPAQLIGIPGEHLD
ncbi:CatB-related O-acetyltransferase [Methylobacterium sp. WL7]|uniref:CatB-related O-acetyltransferase n=1 Tax=Methylobacterium sp. WL7 TaxID=2603900 RepID=UPI0011C9A809|nr:CatB-related O-acetyltransferase [Methylobacterium sp. WL7]TXN38872.1 CatB-related O-acetyltransferase [Methylobacterium sp. WL7]